MGFEDDYNPSGTITKVTRNVLGARGIDRISITENSATTHGYPIYDGHGNCRAILTRDGTDDYATGNWRTYDVWGSVRSGSATGDPKSRYVASIGHVADDESSLIYMRARYYEPATGRFLSQDPAMDGRNWYTYCVNDPVNLVDESGCVTTWEKFAASVFGALGSLMVLFALLKVMVVTSPAMLIDGIRLAFLGVAFAAVGGGAMVSPGASMAIGGSVLAIDGLFSTWMVKLITMGIDASRMTRDIAAIMSEASFGMKTQAFAAVYASALYALAIYAYILKVETSD